MFVIWPFKKKISNTPDESWRAASKFCRTQGASARKTIQMKPFSSLLANGQNKQTDHENTHEQVGFPHHLIKVNSTHGWSHDLPDSSLRWTTFNYDLPPFHWWSASRLHIHNSVQIKIFRQTPSNLSVVFLWSTQCTLWSLCWVVCLLQFIITVVVSFLGIIPVFECASLPLCFLCVLCFFLHSVNSFNSRRHCPATRNKT